MNINSQNIPIVTESYPFDSGEEKGLNLVEIKDSVLRRIPLILITTIATTTLGILKVADNPSIYSGYFEIFSEPVTIETKVSSSSDSRAQETKEEISAVKLDDVQLKLLTSPQLINPIAEKLQSKYPNVSYAHLVSQLKLQPDEDEQVLEVSYSAPDKKQVLDVLETVSQAYLDYSLQTRQTGVNRGIDFLDLQIPKLKQEVEELQLQREYLQNKYNFGDFGTQGEHLSDRLNHLGSQKQDNQDQLIQMKNLAARLEQEFDRELTTSTTAFELATYRYNQLIKRLEQIDSQIALKSTIWSDSNPEIEDLRQKRANLISLIDLESNTIRNKLNNRIKVLEERDRIYAKNIAGVQQQIQQWSAISNDYQIIQGQLELATKKLQESIIQRNSFEVDAAQKQAPWSLLTPVKETGVNSASIVNSGVLGASLGLLLGIGIAIALDKLEDKIYDASKIRQISNLPILGVIPFDSASKKKLLAQTYSDQFTMTEEESELSASEIRPYRQNLNLVNLISSSVESFRFSGANLGLFDADNQIKSLMITSAVAGEGKTSVAFNLAKTVAEFGQRVLLIDTDLRNQRNMTHKMELSHVGGLNNFLLENYLDFQPLLQKLPLEDNLFILTSGNAETSVDSSRLLASSKMQQLSDNLKAHFDLIIYDVAPLVDYADVSLLKTAVDGVILVTGLGKLQSEKLQEALTQLAISNIPVLGVVMNHVKA